MLNDLTFATAPHRVYAAGALVAQDGTFVGEIAPEMAEVAALADELRASVKLPKLSLDVFDYAFKPGEAVIDVVPGKAITGMVRPESAEGLRRIMLIERHGRGVSLQAEGADGDGPAGLGLVGKHIGRGWVRGFTITGGAIASTIGHDSHNVCVVGDNAADMMAAVEAVGQGGHVLVRNGEVVARIPLALGGQMSEGTAEDVAAQHDDFMVKARAHGHRAAGRPHHGHHLPAPAGYPDAPHPPRGHVRRHNLHLRRLVIGDVLKRLVACDTL